MNGVMERFLRLRSLDVIARIALTFPFWGSGLTKLVSFDTGVAEMTRVGLEPPGLFNAATVAVQVGGSLLIIVNCYVWLGAGALGVFTGLTILLVHHFWTMTEEPFRTIAFHTAAEHVGMIGGLLAISILAARDRSSGSALRISTRPVTDG